MPQLLEQQLAKQQLYLGKYFFSGNNLRLLKPKLRPVSAEILFWDEEAEEQRRTGISRQSQ
jgi:hypothetical protein